MQCKHAFAQLNALADGEIRGWQRARLRHHLKTCPTCAAMYSEIQNLGAQAQTWRSVAAPADLKARIQAGLNALPSQSSAERAEALHPQQFAEWDTSLPAMEHVGTTGTLKESTTMMQSTLQHPSLQSPSSAAHRRATYPVLPRVRRALALVGAAIVVAAIFAFLHPRQPMSAGAAGIAFASVRETMLKMQTIHFRVTQSASKGFTEEQNGASRTRAMDYWVRLTPYATAWRDPDGTRHMRAAQGETIFNPHTGQTETDAHSPADREILDFILAPNASSHPAADTKHWESAPVQEAGRALTRFYHRERLETPGKQAGALLTEYTIWADAQTRLVVRGELKLTQTLNDREEGWVKLTLSDFRYNETPPIQMFDLKAASAQP